MGLGPVAPLRVDEDLGCLIGVLRRRGWPGDLGKGVDDNRLMDPVRPVQGPTSRVSTVTAGEWAKAAFWWVAVTVFLNRYFGGVARPDPACATGRCRVGLTKVASATSMRIHLSAANERLTAFEE